MPESKPDLPVEEVVIRPSRSWFQLDLQALWHYRDMLRFLVMRDFVSKYKQTILGPAWFVIQPLLMTLVFTVIFGRVAGLSTDGLPQPLFYLCGMLGWTYFSTCFQGTSTQLITNANLYRKVYFPRMVVPISVVVSNLIAYAIQLVTFLCFWGYYRFFTHAGDTFGMDWTLAFLPLVILQTAAFSLGVGLWMSALTAKYRDLQQISAFLIQVWMYVTPVIYPTSVIPEQLRWLVFLNPMAAIVEAYRGMFLGVATLTTTDVLVSATLTLLVLLSGILIFNRIQRDFVDYA
ncbi:MAG: ABC transporter permease [Puniceicoccaceae bacterium]